LLVFVNEADRLKPSVLLSDFVLEARSTGRQELCIVYFFLNRTQLDTELSSLLLEAPKVGIWISRHKISITINMRRSSLKDVQCLCLGPGLRSRINKTDPPRVIYKLPCPRLLLVVRALSICKQLFKSTKLISRIVQHQLLAKVILVHRAKEIWKRVLDSLGKKGFALSMK
jgi:hypothetical protein